MSQKIKEVLETVVECFESGSVPEAIAYSMFPIPDLPSAKWSLLNRINMFLSGTADARGFRQWKHVKRYVKKGSRAIYILVPRMVRRRETETEETEEEEEDEILTGFMLRPVFRVEDTDGEPLDYQKLELPELPLIQKAKEWGISVKAVPGNYHHYGYFSQDRKEIGLASKEETIFFHELAHVAHQLMTANFKDIECWRKEVVAELSAAVLCKIVGKSSKHLGNNYQYIKHYAKKANMSPVRACLKAMKDVEGVLRLILDLKEGE